MAEKIRYLTREHLQKLNVKGARGAPAWMRFPVVQHMLHNDHEVRATIALDNQGRTAVVDVPILVFNSLPEAEV